MMTMVIEKKMFAAALSILALGCSPAERQEGNPVDTTGIGNLPHVSHDGVRYPYTRYSESTGQVSSRGRAFFLYPIKASKREILALEYSPGMKISDLFGEELLGRGGEAYYSDGQIGFTFLPVSLPVGVVAGQRWRMRYVKHEFLCAARTKENTSEAKKLLISCVNQKYTLSFEYEDKVGVTKFQDFCDFSTCTYNLMDSQGLLSDSMTKLMGFPNI